MSESYRTEEEQLEALKHWWKDNGKSTVLSIVIAIAAVVGWQGWQKQQVQQQEAASAAYQTLLLALSEESQDRQTARHLAETLRKDFTDSTYAKYAALYQAQFAVESGELAEAEQHLNWVLSNASSEELKLQSRLRLARLKYAQQDYVAAMALLAVDGKGYTAAFEEVKGDVLNAQGNKQQALEAYLKAQRSAQAEPGTPGNPLLAIKLQHLQSQLPINGDEK